jgi:hypothetical protein
MILTNADGRSARLQLSSVATSLLDSCLVMSDVVKGMMCSRSSAQPGVSAPADMAEVLVASCDVLPFS